MNLSPWILAARPITLVASIIPIISAMLILPDKLFKNQYFYMDFVCCNYYSNCY